MWLGDAYLLLCLVSTLFLIDSSLRRHINDHSVPCMSRIRPPPIADDCCRKLVNWSWQGLSAWQSWAPTLRS